MVESKNTPVENMDGAKQTGKKSPNWLKISISANIILVILAVGFLIGMEILNQSDTNPNFCATCHNVMDKKVNSYLTGPNLDQVHALAGVQCKECHDDPVSAEIAGGIKYKTGNYEVGANGQLPKLGTMIRCA